MQRTSAFRVLTSALVNAPNGARIQVDQYEVHQSVPRAHAAVTIPIKLLLLFDKDLDGSTIAFSDGIQHEVFKTEVVVKVESIN